MRYYVTTSQTTVHPDDEGFVTRKEARTAMRADAREDFERCKQLWKSAYYDASPDAIEIRAGRDRQCPLWRRFAVVSF
jgi:hypothetical protein